MTPLSTPAMLRAETVSETDYGGRTSAWTEAARLWIALTPGLPGHVALGDAPPARLETATAEARDDARAAVGQQLIVGAPSPSTQPPWTVLAIDRARPAPGRMTLRLERIL